MQSHDRSGRRVARRGGYTLVEMLVVITLATGVLGLVGTTLAVVSRFERQGVESFARTTAIQNLGRQFRRDARMARSAEVVDGALTFALGDDRRAEYRTVEKSVRRRELVGESAVHADQFDVGSAQMEFEVAEDGRLARLLLHRQSNAAKPAQALPERLLVISGAVGEGSEGVE